MTKKNGQTRTPDITMDEFMAEMEKLGESGENSSGQSVIEIMEAQKMSRPKVLLMLKTARQSGRLQTRSRLETNIAGRGTQVPVYSILPAKK